MGSQTTADSGNRPASARGSRAGGRVVIEVQDLEKTFRIPDHRIDSLKERAMHPFTRLEYREHRALRGVSFDVREGEFFGIVGRNGSGKSTLLKILAGIYRADAGRVRTAGRVAPFIELGVGFNPELTARENGVLNGVLMGQSLREARRSLDAVLEFAELEDFVDLKLKNYSSGMLLRFAFAVMVQSDADVMLVDEVLAVGDAAFADKCMEVFRERRRRGRTIVLVTHDMTTVQTLCHRALLLNDGELSFLGEPEDTAIRYYRMNFAGLEPQGPGGKVLDVNARVAGAALRDADGAGVESVESGDPLRLDVVLEAARPLDRPWFRFHVRDADGRAIFEFTRRLDREVPAGGRVRLAGPVENPLVPGRYTLDVYIRQDDDAGHSTLQGLRLLHFLVFGTALDDGLVTVRANVDPVLEEPGA